MSGANLLAYARWHARDSLARSLTSVLLFTALVGIPLMELASREGLASVTEPGRLHEGTAQLYRNILTLTMTLGALLVGSGFVSKDREAGHVRFLFSTPMVPWQFYLLRFVVGLALYSAMFALISVGFSEAVFPVPIAPAIASAVLYGSLLGSLGMLAGALMRHDGVLVIGVVLLGSVLQQLVRASAGNSPAWINGLAKALPPIDAADHIRGAWLNGASAEPGQLTLVLAWSLAMLLASLLLIKRAPLVR